MNVEFHAFIIIIGSVCLYSLSSQFLRNISIAINTAFISSFPSDKPLDICLSWNIGAGVSFRACMIECSILASPSQMLFISLLLQLSNSLSLGIAITLPVCICCTSLAVAITELIATPSILEPCLYFKTIEPALRKMYDKSSKPRS